MFQKHIGDKHALPAYPSKVGKEGTDRFSYLPKDKPSTLTFSHPTLQTDADFVSKLK